MKKITIIGVLIIIAVIAIFGFIIINDVQFNHNNTNSNQSVTMLSASKGGVNVYYPSNWVVSQATSNHSVIAISKQDSIDNQGIGQININVEKKEFTGDFQYFVNKTYNNIQADSGFQLISSGEIQINNEKVLQYIYTSNTSGVEKQHKALWFERNGVAYVILYSAPIDKYDANLAAADYIIKQITIN